MGSTASIVSYSSNSSPFLVFVQSHWRTWIDWILWANTPTSTRTDRQASHNNSKGLSFHRHYDFTVIKSPLFTVILNMNIKFVAIISSSSLLLVLAIIVCIANSKNNNNNIITQTQMNIITLHGRAACLTVISIILATARITWNWCR